MSNTKNQFVPTWTAAESFLSRRIPHQYNSMTNLSRDARSILRDAYQLWYLCTWDTLSSFGVQFDRSMSHRWLSAICDSQVFQLVEILKLSAHQLIIGDFDSYDTFKQYLKTSYPSIGAILAPIKEVLHHWFTTSDTNALRLSYSWLLFISRLNLPGLSDLENEALSKYLLIEQNLPEDGFTSEEIPVLQSWLPKTLEDMAFLTEHHSPQHGPGATADAGNSMHLKYLYLRTDVRLDMLNKRVYGDDCPYIRTSLLPLVRMSKTIFVPKTLGSYRTISMEPASIMWHQKGVRNALMKLFHHKRHYILRRYDPVTQQSNRDYAMIGSIDGSFATIDMSSASDTVSWALVKKWFFNTSLYPWLLWTRSSQTQLPNGRVIKLRKFAPMGSDLCFPVETLIFIAIVECAIMECGDNPKLSEFVVYGDDIVVETKYASTVIRRLQQNGFIPNLEKTFCTEQPCGFFRESCGGYYFNGDDITPLRLSRRFDGYSHLGEENPERTASLIELANDCYSRYPSVRRWCVIQLLNMPYHLRPPFSEDGSVGLFSPNPTNFHIRSKENHSLQVTQYTFGRIVTPKRRKQKAWESIRLYEYLRQTQHRKRLTWPEDRVDVYVSPVPSPVWTSRRASLS